MEKVTKLQKTKFLFVISIFTLLLLILWIQFNFKTALQITFLIWSLFILCTPFSHGKIFLGTPYKFFTGEKLLHPQIFMWSGAILLNLFTYLITPSIYFTTLLTHLLYRIITTPLPYWLVIITCAFATFYKPLIGQKRFNAKKIRHYAVKTILASAGLFAFLYFSYQELVILLNVRS